MASRVHSAVSKVGGFNQRVDTDPNQVAYLSIYCSLIRTCCNAIRTLLQLNSDNYRHRQLLRAVSLHTIEA